MRPISQDLSNYAMRITAYQQFCRRLLDTILGYLTTSSFFFAQHTKFLVATFNRPVTISNIYINRPKSVKWLSMHRKILNIHPFWIFAVPLLVSCRRSSHIWLSRSPHQHRLILIVSSKRSSRFDFVVCTYACVSDVCLRLLLTCFKVGNADRMVLRFFSELEMSK